MIQRLLNGAWTIFVYACVGTIISQAIVLLYLSSAWKIDHERWLRMVAAAQGIESSGEKESQSKGKGEKIAEQASYDQYLEARAMKFRNLELREQQLHDSLSQLQFEQNKLAEEQKRYKRLREGFDSELQSLSEGATASGKDEVRRTLENLKPKQAKELILEMLDKKEIDEVVALLLPMADSKRAKIFGEFKTPEDSAKLSEVLRRIREGMPAANAHENTRKQLEQLKTSQL